ncbi:MULTISPECIES: hypothetical protein [Streptomyces]|nr:hypothetical protein [Streptomyces nigrescens]MEE4424712.1 hypothetical protein [Streptomyces sp. DSM 41528]
MPTDPRTRPPGPDPDRDRRATVLATVLLAASAAALAYVLLGGHHGPVECPAGTAQPARPPAAPR